MDALHSVCWALGVYTLVRGVYCVWSVLSLHWGKTDLARRYGRESWALVTGASYGIGRAIAQELANHGFNLILVARSGDKLQHLAASLRHLVDVQTVVADLSDSASVPLLEAAVAGKQWTILVNNASALHFREFCHLDPTEVRSLISLNVQSVATLTHLFAASKAEKKALINLSSMSGVVPLPMLALYSGTKAFTKGFSQALEKEGAFDVLCLSPVGVRSNMTFNLSGSLESPESYARSALNTLGRTTWTAGSVRQDLMHLAVSALPLALVQSCFRSLVRVLHLFTLP